MTTLPDEDEIAQKERRIGRRIVGLSVSNLVSLVVIVLLLVVISSQSKAIVALSGGVTVLRNQVEDCKGKPASTRGCTAPAAAAPETIIKQVKVPVSVPGVQGVQGLKGDKGDPGTPCLPSIPGCRGPQGEMGPAPACLMLISKCVGATGVKGDKGDPGQSVKGDKGDPGESIKGDKGDPGDKGDKGDKGDQGESIKGDQGDMGRGITSMICPPDDNDPTTDQAWVISWTSAPLQTEGGVCRAKTL